MVSIHRVLVPARERSISCERDRKKRCGPQRLGLCLDQGIKWAGEDSLSSQGEIRACHALEEAAMGKDDPLSA